MKIRPAAVGIVVILLLASRFACQSQAPAKQTVMVAMRDGVKLATDVYVPSDKKSYPVILVRTPYNKDGIAAAAAEGVKRGYVVVVQDTRGRFASEGENVPFVSDNKDGYDTLEWIARQPWCNGKIGTWGGSALSNVRC